jgi:hypothetical protein
LPSNQTNSPPFSFMYEATIPHWIIKILNYL